MSWEILSNEIPLKCNNLFEKDYIEEYWCDIYTNGNDFQQKPLSKYINTSKYLINPNYLQDEHILKIRLPIQDYQTLLNDKGNTFGLYITNYCYQNKQMLDNKLENFLYTGQVEKTLKLKEIDDMLDAVKDKYNFGFETFTEKYEFRKDLAISSDYRRKIYDSVVDDLLNVFDEAQNLYNELIKYNSKIQKNLIQFSDVLLPKIKGEQRHFNFIENDIDIENYKQIEPGLQLVEKIRLSKDIYADWLKKVMALIVKENNEPMNNINKNSKLFERIKYIGDCKAFYDVILSNKDDTESNAKNNNRNNSETRDLIKQFIILQPLTNENSSNSLLSDILTKHNFIIPEDSDVLRMEYKLNSSFNKYDALKQELEKYINSWKRGMYV